jgi:hypothetical protein
MAELALLLFWTDSWKNTTFEIPAEKSHEVLGISVNYCDIGKVEITVSLL